MGRACDACCPVAARWPSRSRARRCACMRSCDRRGARRGLPANGARARGSASATVLPPTDALRPSVAAGASSMARGDGERDPAEHGARRARRSASPGVFRDLNGAIEQRRLPRSCSRSRSRARSSSAPATCWRGPGADGRSTRGCRALSRRSSPARPASAAETCVQRRLQRAIGEQAEAARCRRSSARRRVRPCDDGVQRDDRVHALERARPTR